MPIHACSSGVNAPRTIAAGVDAAQPLATSSDAMAAREPRPISTTTVAEPGVSASSTGRNADSAWPDTTTNADASPRCVTGMPASGGAATALLMPGTTSNGTPAARSASASSPPRPHTNGSPPLRRTTRRPRRALAHHQSLDRLLVDRWGGPRACRPEKRCARGASSSAAGATSAS